MLSVARKFAMHVNRWNTRLWHGQEIDFGDIRSSPRRYDCNNEAPSRPHFSRLAYRYVIGPICKSSNQIKMSASVRVAGWSVDMHAVDKVPREPAFTRWCLMSTAEFTNMNCPKHACYGLCGILAKFLLDRKCDGVSLLHLSNI